MLKAYRLRQFIKMIGEGNRIKEVDKESVFKVLDKIVVMDKEKVMVKYLDGTEMICEMES